MVGFFKNKLKLFHSNIKKIYFKVEENKINGQLKYAFDNY